VSRPARPHVLHAVAPFLRSISALTPASRHRIQEHGEHSILVAPIYVDYAKALLAKAQADGDPFGGALSSDKDKADNAGGSSAPDAADSEDEDDAEGEEGDEDAAAESDDLELSFQCFEVARLIYENVRRIIRDSPV
jgi:hypothetical protein